MAARWDIAAVIVALLAMFISVSPTSLSLVEKVSRKLICLICPTRGRCRRFLWDDVQDGRLHLCSPQGCSHTDDQAYKLHHSKGCWDQTLGHVFNRAWYFMNSESNFKKFVTKKPHQLALNDEYIQADVQTLKAYLLLTTYICRSWERVNEVTLLGIRRSSDLIIVHLPVTCQMPNNTQLTKLEINRIIEGYPPFFREFFTTTGGITLPFPTLTADHVARGAWILSVGMTTTSGPTPSLHNMQRIGHEKLDVYWKGTLVQSAFNMIGRTLIQLKDYENIHVVNPDQRAGEERLFHNALQCFHMIMSLEYSSQPWALKNSQLEDSELFKPMMSGCPCYRMRICPLKHTLKCGRNQHAKKEPAKSLNKPQCMAALEIFNNYESSQSDVQVIWPVLPEILQSLILGMSEVEH